MRKFKNSTMQLLPTPEVLDKKSLTVPNLAPSMREMLQRHAMGIVDNVSYQGTYSGDLPDIRNIEPHELSQRIYENQQRLQALEVQKNEYAIQLSNAEYERKRKRDYENYKAFQAEQENLKS